MANNAKRAVQPSKTAIGTSDPISWDAGAADIVDAIASMAAGLAADISVTVTMGQALDVGATYSLTINARSGEDILGWSSRGDFPLFVSSNAGVTITEAVQGTATAAAMPRCTACEAAAAARLRLRPLLLTC